jgi:hypothetical protein
MLGTKVIIQSITFFGAKQAKKKSMGSITFLFLPNQT